MDFSFTNCGFAFKKVECGNRSILGRVRLGIFRNKNVFRNIFRLFCSWEQNSQNGIQVFRNENSSQRNAYLHYSNYSYSGLIPNERALGLFANLLSFSYP